MLTSRRSRSKSIPGMFFPWEMSSVVVGSEVPDRSVPFFSRRGTGTIRAMSVGTKRRASLGTLPACGGAAELAVAFQGFERLPQSLVLDAQLFPELGARVDLAVGQQGKHFCRSCPRCCGRSRRRVAAVMT